MVKRRKSCESSADRERTQDGVGSQGVTTIASFTRTEVPMFGFTGNFLKFKEEKLLRLGILEEKINELSDGVGLVGVHALYRGLRTNRLRASWTASES